MTIVKMGKMAVLFLLFSLGVTACSISRSMIVSEKKIIMQGLYEFDPPGLNWQRATIEKPFSREGNTEENRDIAFTSCPGIKGIVISRAVYGFPIFLKKSWSKEMDPYSFENIALCYVDDGYYFLKKRQKLSNYEIVSHRTMQLGYYQAIEVICKTREVFATGKAEVKDGELMNKFVVIEAGDRSVFLGNMGFRNWPMIVFWYGSPVEYYEDGLKDFDKMVESFHFIKD